MSFVLCWIWPRQVFRVGMVVCEWYVYRAESVLNTLSDQCSVWQSCVVISHKLFTSVAPCKLWSDSSLGEPRQRSPARGRRGGISVRWAPPCQVQDFMKRGTRSSRLVPFPVNKTDAPRTFLHRHMQPPGGTCGSAVSRAELLVDPTRHRSISPRVPAGFPPQAVARLGEYRLCHPGKGSQYVG